MIICPIRDQVNNVGMHTQDASSEKTLQILFSSRCVELIVVIVINE